MIRKALLTALLAMIPINAWALNPLCPNNAWLSTVLELHGGPQQKTVKISLGQVLLPTDADGIPVKVQAIAVFNLHGLDNTSKIKYDGNDLSFSITIQPNKITRIRIHGLCLFPKYAAHGASRYRFAKLALDKDLVREVLQSGDSQEYLWRNIVKNQ